MVATARTDALEQRRQAILDAALRLFAERGFHGTAVPLIAKAAQVGAGTVYRHFENKEAIVNALYQEQKRTLSMRVISQIETDAPARMQFHAYWSEMAAYARECPHGYRFLEMHHHAPYLDEDSLAIEREITDLAAAAFADFQKQAVIKDVPPHILLSLVHGAFIGFIKGCDQGLFELSDDAVLVAEQCVWEAIRA